jgi:hypothetical protein
MVTGISAQYDGPPAAYTAYAFHDEGGLPMSYAGKGGFWYTSAGVILVLFILLVIVSRPYLY